MVGTDSRVDTFLLCRFGVELMEADLQQGLAGQTVVHSRGAAPREVKAQKRPSLGRPAASPRAC